MELIVVLSRDASAEVVGGALDRLRALGFQLSVSTSAHRTVVGARGPDRAADPQQIEEWAGVEKVIGMTHAYRLSSRAHRSQDTVLDIKGVRVGGPHVNVIAGPCTIENRDRLLSEARAVRAAGATILRGGAFKGRTSPYSFRGLKREGLILLKEAGDALGMPTITEILDPRDLDVVYRYADIFQVGARNLQNYGLLVELGRTDKPVFIKRGPAASIEELLLSAEYVLNEGNPRVMVCERGIRTFNQEVRYTLDVSAVPVIQQRSHLPVFVDPSHAAGRRSLVEPLALAAIAAGASGVMVEVHGCPERALCDGPQALLPIDFCRLMERIRGVVGVLGKEMDAPVGTELVNERTV